MKRNTLVALVFAFVLFAIPTFSQVNSGNIYIDLRAGTYTLNPPLPYGVVIPITVRPSTNPNCTGWYEAFVDISLQPGSDGKARAAYITGEYEGTPNGWTVDIGDSATNDGYGGNDGGAEHAAEVQVLGQTLSVYNDPQIPGQVDNLLTKEMSLTDGALKFMVADQTLGIGSPREVLSTPVTRTLFAIPDVPGPDQWMIHAGFNHVVKKTRDRNGCGLRSVTIWTGAL